MVSVNTVDGIEVIPTGKALGAEVRGIDFSRHLPDELRDEVNRIWAEHLVLLFRGQKLSDEQLLATAEVFGGQQAAGSRAYFVKAGYKAGDTDRVTKKTGISIISNLDKDGKPVKVNESIGSLELKWHSDNSYVATPPKGSLLHAHVVPVNGGGETSFNNQYLAYDGLPDDLKRRIEKKHIRHDNARNSAGRLRPTMSPPRSREDIQGPAHPVVRKHPSTGRRALYLGRRYEWPSSHIVELNDADSESLLDELWDQATRDHLRWTHDWAAGDLVLWDNRWTMHMRNPIDHTQPRVLHRALIKGEPVIPAWQDQAAVESRG